MRYFIGFLIIFFGNSCVFTHVIWAQEKSDCNYRQYIDDAQNALKGTKKNYVLAVQKYLTASYCDPVKAKSDKIDVKISDLFDEIERLRKKSVEDAADAKKFTEEIKKKQDAAKIALRTTYYTEARLQISKPEPGYRLAYLLAKKALDYDAQFLPAKNLADSIFLHCPFDLREKDKEVFSGENMKFWYAFSEIDQDSIQYGKIIDNSNWAYVITRNNNTDRIYWIDTVLQKIVWEANLSFKYEGNWGFYDAAHDWIMTYGPADKEGLNPYSIYSIKEKKIIRTGPPIEYIHVDSISSTLIEIHKIGTRFYSLPDFKLTDTCAFAKLAFLKDSLSAFIKAYELPASNKKRNAKEPERDKLPKFYNYVIEIRDRNGLRTTKMVNNKKLINYNDSYYTNYFNENFWNLVFADSTEMLILGMPDLDTIFYQNPCDFSWESPYNEEWMGMLWFIDYSDDQNRRLKIVDKNNGSNILLERENFENKTALFDESRPIFAIETKVLNMGNKKSDEQPEQTFTEVLSLENGRLRSLGKWNNFIFMKKSKTVVTWTDEKTEIFRLDSSAIGYALKPIITIRGKSVFQGSNFYYDRYNHEYSLPQLVDEENSVYAVYTQISETEILMTLTDSLLNRIGEYTLKNVIDVGAITIEDGFLFTKSRDTDGERVFEARLLSDNKQSFRFSDASKRFADYWIFPTRDRKKGRDFLRIVQLKKGAIKQDSIPFSKEWQVFERNKQFYIAFDSDNKLLVAELGQVKRPIQSWINISEWEIKSGMIFIKQGESERSVFDLIIFDIKNQTTHTYAQKSQYKIYAFKNSGDANLSKYLFLRGEKNDSSWIEIVSFPELKTVIPNCPSQVRGDYWKGERVNLIARSDSTLDYVLIKEQKASGLIYYAYKFPEMVLLDSVENIVAEAWQHQVYSKDNYERNIGCIVKNAAGAVYHFDFNQFRKKMLHKKSSTEGIEKNDFIYYLQEADSLYFYDGFSASLPLLTAFKIPEGAKYDFRFTNNFTRLPKGFIFSTQKNDYHTLWQYSNQNRKVQLLMDSVLRWSDDRGSISIRLGDPTNNQYKTSLSFVSDSPGKLMQAGRVERVERSPSKNQTDFYGNYEYDYFWGFTEDTVRQTNLCRFYKRVKDDIHSFYFQLVDSIPNEKYSYLENQKDKQIKFITDDPRGNLCLCKVDPKPALKCVWYRLPIYGTPKGILQASDDILLSFDKYDPQGSKNGKVSIFSLSKSKKLRDISLPHDRAERWKVSENGYLLHVDLGGDWSSDIESSKSVYFLGSRIEFDAFMQQKQNFTREEAEVFGVE